MDGSQKIKCTVETCKFNNSEQKKCMLDTIHVAPCEDYETMEPDESMCASYEYQD